MKSLLAVLSFLLLGIESHLTAQEASRGIDVHATLTAETVASNQLSDEPRNGSPIILATRSVVYPILKLSDDWSITGAVQAATRPYFYQDFSTEGYGFKGNLLQAALSYSRVSNRGSLVFHAGERPSAFGAFVLRYDETSNPLVNTPPGYGYYYAPVSFLGVTAAQVDATRGKWDSRLQFANSSPANPRNLFAKDQYGNWAGGGGYTIRQGLRVGVSGYRGPYLDRHYAYFYPGEASPNTLPAHGVGIDANWSHRHSWAFVEAQKFVMPYTLFPSFRESTAYGELRQDLSPRWFAAMRYSYTCNSVTGKLHALEAGGAYRLNRHQTLKLSYEEQRYQGRNKAPYHTLGIQLVTSMHRTFFSK